MVLGHLWQYWYVWCLFGYWYESGAGDCGAGDCGGDSAGGGGGGGADAYIMIKQLIPAIMP